MTFTDLPAAIVVDQDGARLAEITWFERGDTRVFDHTWVAPALRGRGVALKLVERAVARAREDGRGIGATCSYVVATLAARPDLR